MPPCENDKMVGNFETKVIKLYRCDVYSSKWCRSINNLGNSVFSASLSGTQKRDSGESNNNEKYTKSLHILKWEFQVISHRQNFDN